MTAPEETVQSPVSKPMVLAFLPMPELFYWSSDMPLLTSKRLHVTTSDLQAPTTITSYRALLDLLSYAISLPKNILNKSKYEEVG